MATILLITDRNNSLSDFSSMLKQDGDIEISWAISGEDALDLVSKKTFDLAVVDEHLGDMTGLEFVKKLVRANPMMNSSVVSRLSPEEFHEAGEGLGILAPLPLRPGKADADNLIRQLKTILNLQKGIAGHEGGAR